MNTEDSSTSSSSSGIPEEISQAYVSSSFEELPSKGYSQLYKVKRGGRFIICKCLKPEFRGQGFYEALLKKEYEIGISLDHSNIVKVYDFYTDATYGSTITMEWVDGCDLAGWLSGKHSNDEKLKVVKEILYALNYCHSKQIIHRDLKPSNILITRNGNTVKLIDFGLSDTDDYAVLKQPAGTINYAAPEQLTSGCKIDQRADIYSFGKILKLIFPHKYCYIARKCSSDDVFRRYANVSQIEVAINRVNRIPFYANVVLLVLITCFSVLYAAFVNKKGVVATQQHTVDTVVVRSVDTVVVHSVDTVVWTATKADSIRYCQEQDLKKHLSFTKDVLKKTYNKCATEPYEEAAYAYYLIADARIDSSLLRLAYKWREYHSFVSSMYSASNNITIQGWYDIRNDFSEHMIGADMLLDDSVYVRISRMKNTSDSIYAANKRYKLKMGL